MTELFSKKMVISIGSIALLVLDSIFGWGLTDDTKNQILGIAAVYVGGQSLVDSTKNLKK